MVFFLTSACAYLSYLTSSDTGSDTGVGSGTYTVPASWTTAPGEPSCDRHAEFDDDAFVDLSTGAPSVPTVCTSLQSVYLASQGAYGYRLADLDLETETWSTLVEVEPGATFSSVEGLGLTDEGGYVCSNEVLTRIDLVTGAAETSAVTCAAATVVNGEIVVLDSPVGCLAGYASWADALAGTSRPIPASPWASRMGGGADGIAFAAWHAGSEVTAWDPATGAFLGHIALENFYTWIWGVSAVGDRLFVLNDGRDETVPAELEDAFRPVRIAEFDLGGAATRDYWLEDGIDLEGLACRPK